MAIKRSSGSIPAQTNHAARRNDPGARRFAFCSLFHAEHQLGIGRERPALRGDELFGCVAGGAQRRIFGRTLSRMNSAELCTSLMAW